MKLRKLLNESTAAEEAKSKGLTSDGFGRWKNKQGKTVAMTDPDTGKLVPVKGDDSAQPRDQSSDIAKPTGTSAEKAGTAVKSAPGQKDIEKQNGTLDGQDRGGENDPDEGEPEASPMSTVKPNPYLQNFDISLGKPINKSELSALFANVHDPLDVLKERHPNEELIVMTDKELQSFWTSVDSDEKTILAQAEQDAKRQHSELQKQLDRQDARVLYKAQLMWQGSGLFRKSEKLRNAVQKGINSVCGRLMPVTRPQRPLERGIRVKPDQIDEFLQQFHPGNKLAMTAGFSFDPFTARQYALPTVDHYGVVMRLAPNEQGEVYGLHLSHAQPVGLKKSDAQDFATQVNANRWEAEVVRYNRPQARVAGIKKLMGFNEVQNMMTCVYVIELVEEGIPTRIAEGTRMASHSIQRRFKALTETEPKAVNGEKSAADQAHDLGLISVGGAYWADSSGDIVAQTIQDKLVKFTGHEDLGGLSGFTKDGQYHKIGKFTDPNTKDEPLAGPGITGPGTEGKSTIAQTFTQETDLTGHKLNGIPFEPWVEAINFSKDDWNSLANPDVKEPVFPTVPGKKHAAGCIIIEPDGRFWLVEPANHFGGYEHTFPKGKLEPDMTAQSTAIKETYEESGLQVEITGYAADSERTTSITRYYFAKRIGGTPASFGWETQAVKLVPPNELNKYLNMDIDKKLAQQVLAQVHDHGPSAAPSEHPEQKINKQKAAIMHQKMGSQQGTNPGGFYKGTDGILRYVKEYKDPSRSETEDLADKMYNLLDISAPKSQVIDDNGKKLFASDVILDSEELGQFIQGASPELRKHVCRQICSGFAADVLMGNWDTIGLELDNIMVDQEGMPYRIDQGGSFLFRAMESSGRKPNEALGKISEWDVFNSPQNKYSEVLKTAGFNSPDQIPDIILQIKDIRKLEKESGGWQKLVDKIVPNMAPNDKERIIEMLNVRSKLLYDKALKLQFQNRDI